MNIKTIIFISVFFPLMLFGESLENRDLEKGLLTITDTKILNDTGKALYKKGDYYMAVKYFERLVILKPESIGGHYNLGLSYLALEQNDKALSQFQQVIQLNPDYKRANKKIDQILPSTISLPVIYYDWKSDLSNSDFNYNAGTIVRKAIASNITRSVITTAGNKKYRLTGNTEMFAFGSLQRLPFHEIIKPGDNIKFFLHPNNQDEILIISHPWHNMMPETGGLIKGMVKTYLSRDKKPVVKKYSYQARNYLMDKWFCPSGIENTPADFIYNKIKARWEWIGLKQYNEQEDEFVGMNFDINEGNANIVVYDHLKFELLPGKRSSTGVYYFDDQDFFPLDRRGFEEAEFGHNYGFAMEMHTKILYRGGEFFKFRGDDDIWLFIDGKLQMDMGGVHGPASDEVRLDNIPGLKRGRIYDVDLFFAERNPTGSSLRIEGTFMVDIPAPQPVNIAVNRKTFIPGEEEIKISIISEEKQHTMWEILIRDDGNNNTVRTYRGNGEIPSEISWDARDNNNNTVEWNKRFHAVAMGIDEKGNSWKSNIETIRTMVEFEKGDKITVRSVVFAPFSYEIKEEATLVLDRMSKLLEKNDKIKLVIKGHVSSYSKWTDEQLYALSLQRAQSVKAYLVNKGVTPGRIEAIGMSYKEPFRDTNGKIDNEKSRRTAFEIQ